MSAETKISQQSIVNNCLENALEAHLETEPPEKVMNDKLAYAMSQMSRKEEEIAKLQQENADLKQAVVVEHTAPAATDDMTPILASPQKIMKFAKNSEKPLEQYARLLNHIDSLKNDVMNTAKQHYSTANRPWSTVKEQLLAEASRQADDTMPHKKPQTINC